MLDEQAPSSSILRTCTRSLVAAQPAALAVTDLAPALEVPEPRTRPARFRGAAQQANQESSGTSAESPPIPSLALIQVSEEAMDNGSDVEEESDDEVEPCGGSAHARRWCA